MRLLLLAIAATTAAAAVVRGDALAVAAVLGDENVAPLVKRDVASARSHTNAAAAAAAKAQARMAKAARAEEKKAAKAAFLASKKAHTNTLSGKEWHRMLREQRALLKQHHAALHHVEAAVAKEDAKIAERMVSVVVPTNARPEYVQHALHRLDEELYPWLEAIVVDDSEACAAAAYIDVAEADGWRYTQHEHDRFGFAVQRDRLATDGTFRRVRYACAHKRLTPGEKRNRGVALAGGKYVAFADDNLLFAHDRLTKQLAYAQRHALDIAVLELDLMVGIANGKFAVYQAHAPNASASARASGAASASAAAPPRLPRHYATILFDRAAVLGCNASGDVRFAHTWDETFGEAAQFARDAVEHCDATIGVVRYEDLSHEPAADAAAEAANAAARAASKWAPVPPPPPPSGNGGDDDGAAADDEARASVSIFLATASSDADTKAGRKLDAELAALDFSTPPQWAYVVYHTLSTKDTRLNLSKVKYGSDAWPAGDWLSKSTLKELVASDTHSKAAVADAAAAAATDDDASTLADDSVDADANTESDLDASSDGDFSTA